MQPELSAKIDYLSVRNIDGEAGSDLRHACPQLAKCKSSTIGIDNLEFNRSFENNDRALEKFNLGQTTLQLERTRLQSIARGRSNQRVVRPLDANRFGKNGDGVYDNGSFPVLRRRFLDGRKLIFYLFPVDPSSRKIKPRDQQGGDQQGGTYEFRYFFDRGNGERLFCFVAKPFVCIMNQARRHIHKQDVSLPHFLGFLYPLFKLGFFGRRKVVFDQAVEKIVQFHRFLVRQTHLTCSVDTSKDTQSKSVLRMRVRAL